MEKADLQKLLNNIDMLVTQSLAKRSGKRSRIALPDDVDIENILESGVYPPDDPTSAPRRTLLAIGETLGLVGGSELMHQVHNAYEAQYGIRRAAILSVRWDTAAGLWHH